MSEGLRRNFRMSRSMMAKIRPKFMLAAPTPQRNFVRRGSFVKMADIKPLAAGRFVAQGAAGVMRETRRRAWCPAPSLAAR